MANNFSTERLKRESEKILFVRIKPRRDIANTLSLDSGTTYTATFAFNTIPDLKVDGTSYTKVSGTPSAGQFSFNEVSKLLTINLGAALSSQKVIASYYLFYTNSLFRQTYEDPASSSTALRQWEPRIDVAPNFTFSIKDIMAGFFSFSNSNLTLINNDYAFNQYLGDNDSFYNAEIKFWHVLNNNENVQAIYTGEIKDLNVKKKVSINFDDAFSKLDQVFYSNGTFEKSFILSSNYTIDSGDELIPIPKLFGRRSKYRPTNFLPPALDNQIDLGLWLEARNVNFSTTKSPTTNHRWLANVAPSIDPSILMTVTGVLTLPTRVTVNQYGDELARYDYLRRTSDGANGNVVQRNSSSQFQFTGFTPAVSDVLERRAITHVIVARGDGTNQLGFPLTTGWSLSINSDGVYEITITNVGDGKGDIEPNSDRVFYQCVTDPTDDRNHSDILKDIIEGAGLTTNAASFTAAKSALSMETLFTLPFDGESSFPTYREVIEKILFSTRGYLLLNDSNEVEYHLFDAPSSSQTIEERDFLLNTLGIKIDYKDIVTSLSCKNDNGYVDWQFSSSHVNARQSANSTNNKAKHLHETNRSENYDVVVKELSTSRNRILSLLAERRATYFYETKGRHFESLIGDDDGLNITGLLGTDTTRDVKAVSLTKSKEKTIVKAMDLLGL